MSFNFFGCSCLEESLCLLSRHTASFIAFVGLTLLYTCDFSDSFDSRLGVLFGGLHFDSVQIVSYAALVSCCSVSRSAKCTTFAV